jgi:monoterpene epsilon-lactone hydrolase
MPSPELAEVVALLRGHPADADATIDDLRTRLEVFAALSPMPDGVVCEPTVAGTVPGEWLVGPDVAAAVVLYLHGGGYVLGSLDTHRALAARIALAAGTRGLMVDYRLAPEHPFPAAVEDAVAAYEWLLAEGFPPHRVVLAGDSAGGGLAVATLLALRDAGIALPAGAACLSPWVDLAATGESLRRGPSADPMLQRDGVVKMAAAYLSGADPRTPLASPLYANLADLPPLLVQVGTSEALLDDARRLTRRVRACGGVAHLEEWNDMIHVWHAFAPILPEAVRAIAGVGCFVRAAMRVATPDRRHDPAAMAKGFQETLAALRG